MDWVASGCCTLLAAYILYRFLTREKDFDAAKGATESRPATISQTKPAMDRIPHSAPTMELMRVPEAKSNSKNDVATLPVVRGPPETIETPALAPPTVTMPPSPPRLKPPTFGSMLAPPRPGNGALRPPPSAASSLRVPPTKVLSNSSMAPTSSIMPPGKQVSRKVMLEPGHSPLDWAALTSSPNSRLRGKDAPDNLTRVTPTQLKQQNGRKGRDAWTTYQGKVYNITPYVPFHPGGKGEILRGAGKHSDTLFTEVHPWVNWDGMLSECLVGILVNDEEASDAKSGGLDDMD